MSFVTTPFTKEITTFDVIATMQNFKGWEEKYRQVIQWGKLLPKMPEEFKTAQVTVAGCESEVWLVSEQRNGQWFFCVDSDARIVRGLIALVMSAFDGCSSEEILAFDIEGYFDQLGLIQHLSPSRGNGLKAIVDQIKEQVQ
ncbi:SufE family protein [Vibrio algarum]|uniref:SufE family protein n=1 Tax=Vibrio algarum TaxID=3020714 RepID=A0ABT4YNP3_9VIBR|nr:SufE family protein [Vibrio sp. KJ40-1]MDB1123172.1 SufE family protein [Vibrio sp. KJ40-1]